MEDARSSFQRDGAVGRLGGEAGELVPNLLAGALAPNLLHTVDAFSDYSDQTVCIRKDSFMEDVAASGIRQYTSAYVSIRQRMIKDSFMEDGAASGIRQHTSADHKRLFYGGRRTLLFYDAMPTFFGVL